MKILRKILVPILISTLLLINVGFNVVYHTCKSTGEINISIFIEELCQSDDCSISEKLEKTNNHCCYTENLDTENLDTENLECEKSSKFDNKNKNCSNHESIENKLGHINYFSNNNNNTNYTSILDECCSSETDYIQTKLDFTLNYIDFNFKSDLVIGENLKFKINDLNNDYKVILDNIDTKIKKIPTKTLSYLIKYIYTTNSSKEGYIY